MKLYSENENYKLYQGNMLDMLEVIETDSIDSIVTDPPYELNFMGKGWDNSGIAFQPDTWKKCYEVLKPGGYLLAFGGSRTFHRIACAIEDAGFEIRDTIMWLYGSGFPNTKSNGGKQTTRNFTDYNGGSCNSYMNISNRKIDTGRIDTGYVAPCDSGSASRYFYCAKASKKDRDEGLDEFEEKKTGELQGGRKEGSAGSIMLNIDGTTRVNPYAGTGTPKKNIHPTVKPTDLMQYLVRLVTPNNGTVLDPFNGSGSTGKAVMYENKERNKNYKYIGIELTEEYLPITKARIEYICNLKEEESSQMTIFDMLGDDINEKI